MKEKEKPSYSIAVQQNQFKMVRYPDYEAAYGQIATAARYHKMCRIIGHPGSGKTSLPATTTAMGRPSIEARPSRASTSS